MNKITIKDIYSGKPDAKDEINFEGISDFIKTFITPRNIDLDTLLNGTHCFISGYKGTGKTALLFYLDDLARKRDSSTCSSFIFFKEEFSIAKREGFEDSRNRELSSISIDKETLLNNKEFEYIWRWLLLKRIVAANDEFNGGLFVQDDDWRNFERLVSKIKDPINMKKSSIVNKIKIAMSITSPIGGSVSPELEVDLGGGSSDSNYSSFIQLVDEAEYALSKIKKTDIPYYIFVDELEAYYGDETVFKRDLYLIRDLIFTIKRFNSIFATSNMNNIKIICSVRSEIINAISRFIVTKELNKVISGFEIPLKWNYTNTNSFNHPILQILLKRIEISNNNCYRNDKDIIADWFPEKIYGIDPANYILNNSWNKPRDIVRFIISAQNSINSDSKSFSQAVFDDLNRQYSMGSLDEIREEMRALYTSEQIEDIINIFTGVEPYFSVQEMKDRISEKFPGSIMDVEFNNVINDLYRLGFVGNYSVDSKMYRWQHKDDHRLIMTDEWKIMIHRALYSALSINRKNKRVKRPIEGDVVNFKVNNISKFFANGFVKVGGKNFPAYIHISMIADTYIHDINEFISNGEDLKAEVLEYDNTRKKLSLRKISEL